MEYRVLGPLEVLDASGRKLRLGGAMQQSVLAALLLHPGQTVALDRLVDELWDEPPETAARTVQAYISRLRHELPKGAIESQPGGYRLVLDRDNLDLETFGRQAEEGHRALAGGQREEAGRLLRSALALWRGPALAGLTSEPLRLQAERLEELRLTALEDRFEADLGCAREAEIVPELKTLVAEHPFRERLRAQLMRALYRSGRPGEALALYRETRRLLVDELGIEPGQDLRELEQAILRQDTELEAPALRRSTARAEPAPAEPKPRIEQSPPREVRKTVTILFCDIVDSTGRGESTDPEVVRSRLARFFDEMKTVIDRHGGTVEKFIGDAVMAVFGVPIAHEDDALRACRAAIEMQEALPALEIEGRIGLMTGEVVTGTEERLATGDAVNVAARLEQAAGPGEVLIGKSTLELVHAAVEVEALEPLALKGKTQPVEAFRLNAVYEPVARPAETPFVGREQELAAIKAAWERALAERRCEFFTVIGDAGIGKSRLVAEALASVDGRTVQGRCLPYGKGITYWPVVQVVNQLESLPADPAAASAIRSLLRESEAGAPSAEEIASAFRKLLEERAPLVVVFDDIQWGEETFLDLLEHVALLATESPILLLCLARPELAEGHPAWPITARLEPLPDDAVDKLIGARVAAETRDRIARAAGGNPLFVSEMLTMAQQTAGEVIVPPTLTALLAARLDQLDSAERSVVERAAIEGEVFHRGAVRALGPEETQVTRQLASLVRKGLIHSVKSEFEGEDGFRFRHLLVRDAAYESLPKTKRAALHERFAAWLEERSVGRPELDEILGYHLEQAHDYRLELQPTDDHARDLGVRAGRLLGRAGARALGRNDVEAALKLLGRAVRLYDENDPGVAVRLDLSHALFLAGDFATAAELAEEVAERAARVGDQAGELRARLAAARIAAQVPQEEPVGTEPSTELLTLAERARPVFAAVEDQVGLTDAWLATAWAHLIRCRWKAMLEAVDRAHGHARAAGYVRWEHEFPVWKSTALFYGPTPVKEALRWYAEEAPQHAIALNQRAVLEAMLCRFHEARGLLKAADTAAAERGEAVWRISGGMAAWEVEMLAGDASAAERVARATTSLLEKLGDSAFRSLAAGQLAASLYELGHLEQARTWTESAEELSSRDDVVSHMLWRQVRAKLLAQEGGHVEAERLAVEAVSLGNETEMLNWQANALRDLAEVYLIGRRSPEGQAYLEKAVELYGQKGNVASASRARSALERMSTTTSTL